MTEPADALNAVETAAYQLLSAGISGATVLQHAGEGQAMPLVIISDMDDARKITGKGASRSRGIPLSILVLTEGEERRPCSVLIGQVEQLLDDVTVDLGNFRVTFYHERSAAVIDEAGNGYVGLSRFNAFAIAD